MWKFAFLFLFIFAGCESGITSTSRNIRTDVEFNQLILADVEQAILLAERTEDIISLQCWKYVYDYTLEHTPIGASIETDGVLSVYQRARNVRRVVLDSKVTDEFRLACGPMLMDSLGVFKRLGLRLAL